MEKTQHVMLIAKGAEEFASTLSSAMIETRPDDGINYKLFEIVKLII